MTTELNFISFPNELTTGSSIMPHKKNPDLFELIRAKCNAIKSLSNEFNIISTNLTSGYHRDMQQYKSKIIEAIQTIKNCIEIFSSSIKKIEIKNDILNNNNYKYIFSVDNLNSLMIDEGLSFRDAYNEISKSIKKKSYKPKKRVKQTLIGGIDNLCLEKIKIKMNRNF